MSSQSPRWRSFACQHGAYHVTHRFCAQALGGDRKPSFDLVVVVCVETLRSATARSCLHDDRWPCELVSSSFGDGNIYVTPDKVHQTALRLPGSRCCPEGSPSHDAHCRADAAQTNMRRHHERKDWRFKETEQRVTISRHTIPLSYACCPVSSRDAFLP